MTAKPLLLAAALLLSTALPAEADPHPRCFSMSEMNGWRSPDGKTIYLRMGADRYYRLELSRQCSTLKSVNPHLVLRNRQGGTICSALDLDVKASQSPGGIVEPCFPKTLTELTPAEAAALPKDARP
ncbi:MAG TPA: DUF6491 family protein [Rhizomicrobium sp.]|nr:DUF6491 family protein [Rhizomicrobium sp.]